MGEQEMQLTDDQAGKSGGKLLIGIGGLIAFLVLAVLVKMTLFSGSEEQRRFGGAVPVTTLTLESREFVDTIEAVGTARASESVTVTASITETVHSINFESGATVAAGDILAELTSSEEAASLSQARTQALEAGRQFNRIKSLRDKGAASQAQFEVAQAGRDQADAQVQAIEARLADRLIRAPFSGVVGLRLMSPGALARPGDAIATLDDISAIKLDFTVPERFISGLEKGLALTAKSSAWPERVFAGEVAFIDTRIDPVTRTVTVRAILDNGDMALRPGMLMSVELQRNKRQSLAVPELSVVVLADREMVFVASWRRPARLRQVPARTAGSRFWAVLKRVKLSSMKASIACAMACL